MTWLRDSNTHCNKSEQGNSKSDQERVVMCDDKEKHDVYEYITRDGISHFFSKGVKREFGENKVVFVDGHQVFASVMPLHTSNGLKLVGHLYT